jgi:hypothetical protein
MQVFTLRSSAPAGTQIALLPEQSAFAVHCEAAQILLGTVNKPPHEGPTGVRTHVVPAAQVSFGSDGQHLSVVPPHVGGGTGTTQVRKPPTESATH